MHAGKYARRACKQGSSNYVRVDRAIACRTWYSSLWDRVDEVKNVCVHVCVCMQGQPVVLHVVDKALPALLATAPWEVLGDLTPPPVAMDRHQLKEEQHQQHTTAQHSTCEGTYSAQSLHLCTTQLRLGARLFWCLLKDSS